MHRFRIPPVSRTGGSSLARTRTRWLACAFASAIATGGCTGILGDFKTSREAPDTATDASLDATTDAADSGRDGAADEGSDATVADAGAASDGDARDAGQPEAGSDAGPGCVASGTCDPGDCKTGAWGCDGGPVCQSTGTKGNGAPCGAGGGDAGTAHVCNAGACVACNAGADCTDAGSCTKSSIDCTSGSPVCTAAGNRGDGASCGANPPLYCYGGVCSACTVGASCAPSASPCDVGMVTSCVGGVATCADQGVPAQAGRSCSTATISSGACDGQGACVSCTPNAVCQPDACQSGVTSCVSGPTCTLLTPVHDGQPCATGQVCHGGACVACDATSCPNGCCGLSGCVAIADQTAGACAAGGAACASCPAPLGTGSAVCSGGACDFTCGASFTRCASGCWNTQTDPAHCGASCAACSLPNTTAGCTAGACTVAQCQAGHLDCDGLASNGCEASTLTDPAHCGGCAPCNLASATARCAAGVCAVQACSAGFADCNGSATDGCETNLMTTATSCGACGHGCLFTGAGCVGGQCQAIAIASNLSDPYDFAIDSSFLYWTDAIDETVSEIPLGGGTVTTVATGQSTPNFIAVNATGLYWSNDSAGSLQRESLPAGGTPLTILPSPGTMSSYFLEIAIDSSQIYWTDAYNNLVMRMSVNGGTPTTLASGRNSPAALAVDSSNLYWLEDANPGAVMKIPITGGTPTTLAPATFPFHIAIDATSVYWSNNGPVMKVAIAGGTPTTLVSYPVGTGVATMIVSSGNLYYGINATATVGAFVMKVPVAGGTPTTVVSGVSSLGSMAVDATAVYFGNGQSIMKVAK